MALHAPQPEPGADGSFVVVRYEYSEAGDMVRTTDALGHAMAFAYEHHLLVRETNRVGLSFYFRYDGPGPEARCLRTWGDGGIYDTTLRYESAAHTVVTNSVGYTKHYTHRNGLVVVMLDSLGAVRRWTYNDDTDLTLERDALGQATSYEYDARGNQTLVTYPTGARVATQYNEQDLPVLVTEPNDAMWQWRYDTKGNLVARIDPAGATTHYIYNTQGQLLDLTDAAGQTTHLRYDEQQSISHVMTASGQISSYQYDQLGRLTHLTDARGNVRRQYYDALGQLIAVREADGTEQLFAYDGESNVLRAQDAKRAVEFRYAGLNQLVTRTEAGLQVAFAYNTEGQLTSVQNEQGEQYRFALDAAGRVVTEVGFDGLIRHYQLDAAGRVTEVLRPAGRFTRYDYDAMGRVLAVIHNDEAPITYAYGPDGTLREAHTAGSTVVLERDVLGRILSETQGAHTIWSAYDQRGQRVGLHSSLGADLAMERNTLGNITHAQAGAWFSRIERDEQGLELQRTLSGGVQLRWSS